MVNDTDRFHHELKTYLESFRQQGDLPKVPVTMTSIPREGLTVKYQHPSAGPVDPADLANEAAKVIGAAGIGTAGGAVIAQSLAR